MPATVDGETFAWPTYVAQVLRLRDTLPPA
jgi:hypothetical protein